MRKLLCFLIAPILLISLGGCFGTYNEKLVVGTWIAKKNTIGLISETEYIFNEDGTGSMSTILDIKVAITYKIDEENLTIVTDTPTLKKTYVYTYDFVDDTLILTDQEGNKIILYKL